ncbi:MAG: PHP domain-containing protein [Acidimicrobiia bacterium]
MVSDRKPSLSRAFGAALWQLAGLVRASERRRSFRAKAFRTAVWALDDLSRDLDESDDQLQTAAGIGPGIVRLVDEFRTTGKLAELEKLAALYPADAGRMSRLPRITPGRLRALKALGVDETQDLLAAVESRAVESIEGIGPATAEKWQRVLALPPTPGVIPAHDAFVVASLLSSHLRRHLVGDEVAIAGSVRRMDEWVAVLDIVVVTDDPERASHLLEVTAVATSTESQFPSGATLLLHDGLRANVHLSKRSAAGSVLVEATGPPAHLEELVSALTHDHATEEDVYRATGRVWVPAPARVRPSPPADVVTENALRGDLHLHSDWSPDGHMAMEAILSAAVERGYDYVAITDHTIGLRFGGLDSAALRRQRSMIDDLRAGFPDLVVLHAAEINIDRHGRPDLEENALAELDFVVAGCHSDFDLAPNIQTERIVAALSHPAVRVLAHPTGRRIGIRPGFDLDIDAVIATAVDFDVALEVNGHRDRLDLSADFAERAGAAGARLAANSDAHRFEELANILNAVGVMQRAGVRPGAVVNTMSPDRFLTWLRPDNQC